MHVDSQVKIIAEGLVNRDWVGKKGIIVGICSELSPSHYLVKLEREDEAVVIRGDEMKEVNNAY